MSPSEAVSPTAHYTGDIHLARIQTAPVRAFRVVLSAFVRGRAHLYFGDAAQVTAALRRSGFAAAELHRASSLAPEIRGRGTELGHILEASIR